MFGSPGSSTRSWPKALAGKISNVTAGPIWLRLICACVLFGILVAGLWPFHAPRNEVRWLSGGHGLLFGRHGSITSAALLKASAAGDQPCSLEIWLEPARLESGGTALAFYWPESEVTAFGLRQWRNGLVLERERHGHSPWKASIYVPGVFLRPGPVFVSIASSAQGTAVYVDGKLVKTAPDFVVSGRNFSGQLIVGNGPSAASGWSGQVRGLAVYDRQLSANEVAHNFSSWSAGWVEGSQRPSAGGNGLIARYLFTEGKGEIVSNQVDAATSLVIPKRFFVVDKDFLERPWDEFRSGWHYWKDIAVNVVGFIPLGLFFCAKFSETQEENRSVWLTILLGFFVSLTIEVLQYFLPTRDSGMTDLITNTSGTALGVIFWRWCVDQSTGAYRRRQT